MRTAAATNIENGAAGSDDHDHEDEHRLREIAVLHVVDRIRLAGQDNQGDDQDKGPEPEHHLDLGEQVPQAGMPGLDMGQASKPLGRESVQHSQRKYDGGNDFGVEMASELMRGSR
jgi:hypothetical protein